MGQTVEITIQDVAEFGAAVAAAKTLKATEIRARGGGTWVEVKRGERRGDLCFRLDRIVRPLRGGRRVRAVVDGKEITVEPYEGGAFIVLRITF